MSAVPRHRHLDEHRRSPSTAGGSQVLATLVLHREVIDQVQRMAQALTDGDFDALVIWCALARQEEATPGNDPRPLALHEMVAATAIPRETVRRKLRILEAQGRVKRAGRGWIASVALPEQAAARRG